MPIQLVISQVCGRGRVRFSGALGLSVPRRCLWHLLRCTEHVKRTITLRSKTSFLFTDSTDAEISRGPRGLRGKNRQREYMKQR